MRSPSLPLTRGRLGGGSLRIGKLFYETLHWWHVTVKMVSIQVRALRFVRHPERSAEQRDARSRRIYAERFVGFGQAEMNRFALIPPLRALAGAPVGMTRKEALRY